MQILFNKVSLQNGFCPDAFSRISASHQTPKKKNNQQQQQLETK